METAAPQVPRTNGLAVAGFVLALCAVVIFWLPVVAQIVWVLGLIFSAIGLSRARKGYPRRGLAIAGLVVSLAGAVLAVLFFVEIFAVELAGA